MVMTKSTAEQSPLYAGHFQMVLLWGHIRPLSNRKHGDKSMALSVTLTRSRHLQLNVRRSPYGKLTNAHCIGNPFDPPGARTEIAPTERLRSARGIKQTRHADALHVIISV